MQVCIFFQVEDDDDNTSSDSDSESQNDILGDSGALVAAECDTPLAAEEASEADDDHEEPICSKSNY